MRIGHMAAFLSVIAFVLQGCATTPEGRSSAMDGAIAKCVLSVGASALLGAFIGNRVGDGSGTRGALIGGAIGGAACAVFMKLANDQDRARIADLERQAVADNRNSADTFTSKDGSQVYMQTNVTEASIPASAQGDAPAYETCRYTNKTIAIDGQSADVKPQLWCSVKAVDGTSVWSQVEVPSVPSGSR